MYEGVFMLERSEGGKEALCHNWDIVAVTGILVFTSAEAK